LQNQNQNHQKDIIYMENLNNNQGRTDKQYENSARFAGYSIMGIIILIIFLTLFGGCATTHDTSKECCKSKKTSTE